MRTTLTQKILDLATCRGVIRPRDLQDMAAPSGILKRLVERGHLVQTARGLYSNPAFDMTEHHTKVEVATRIPQSVICLLSALQFHDLGTQEPHEVWIALPKGSRQPTCDLPVRIHRFDKESLRHGIQTHMIEGIPVRITSPARTVADCWKFRNKIGLDVAMEALRAYLDRRPDNPSAIGDLLSAAAVCRIERVLRPYLEAMI